MEKSWNSRFLYGVLYAKRREVVEKKTVDKLDFSTTYCREIVVKYVCPKGRESNDSNGYV